MKDPKTLPRVVRLALIGIGLLMVGLGLLGVLLPVLPTTPFMLVAAACFGRASPRFHARLLANPVFGPTVRDWEETRSIRQRPRVVAISLLVLTMGTSIIFVVKPLIARIIMTIGGIVLVTFLARLPAREDLPD